MDQVVAIVDMQFGSTGKGQVAGLVGRYWAPDTVICANGPNAGHTFQWETAEHGGTVHKIVCRALPCAAVSPSVRNVMIGPGAVLDIPQLLTEIEELGPWLRGKTLVLHPNVPVLRHSHATIERGALLRIGSTMKGTGEALVDKIRRDPEAVLSGCPWASEVIQSTLSKFGIHLAVNAQYYDRAIDSSRRLLVEGAQGFSLGIHTQFYPYTTSRDLSTHQLLADCRLPRIDSENLTVIGVVRTYPIRVANRYGANNEVLGTSGGCYSDQVEMRWEQINREPELTTVTRLPRRLFSFSTQQIIEAARILAPDFTVLNFCDYVAPKPPSDAGPVPEEVLRLARKLRAAAATPIMGLGFGPNEADMIGILSTKVEGELVYRAVPAADTWGRILNGRPKWATI